jgi:hypothetical protein
MLIKRLSVLAVATSLVACASTTAQKAETVTPAPVTRVVEVAPPVPVHPYAMPSRQARVVPQAPEWYVRMPEDTAEMTFAVGTATSTDEQMAYDKARMAAERKLVEQMYARITTQTNSFKADRGSATIENYQQVTRKNARGELSGAQRVDSQVTHDGVTAVSLKDQAACRGQHSTTGTGCFPSSFLIDRVPGQQVCSGLGCLGVGGGCCFTGRVAGKVIGADIVQTLHVLKGGSG